MEDATDRDDATHFVPDEIDRVGKAFSGGQSIGADSLAKNLRRDGNHAEFSFNAFDERMAEAGGSLLIPSEALAKIGFRQGQFCSQGKKRTIQKPSVRKV